MLDFASNNTFPIYSTIGPYSSWNIIPLLLFLQVWPDLPNITIDETITEDEAVNVSLILLNSKIQILKLNIILAFT